MKSFVSVIVCCMVFASSSFSAPNGYSFALAPGEEAEFNQIRVACNSGEVDVRFGNYGRPDFGSGRGWSQSAYADCHTSSKTLIRVKAGYETPPQGWGTCGADPGKMLSIWVDGRKIVSRYEYAPYCSELVLKSIRITARGAVLCTLSMADDPNPENERQYSTLPKRSACLFKPVTLAIGRDGAEFSSVPPLADIGHLFVQESKSNAAWCAAFIDPADTTRLRMPASVRQPAWTTVKTSDGQFDASGLGFNATTFSMRETMKSEFDLENDGRVTTVYQHNEENHWFAGSALARDRPGILKAPFDAHDWDRSIRSGIYVFVYDHATVFFDQGRTFILLDPENPANDPRVITLNRGTQTEICKIKRRQENF
jgi:hypothetical protein